MTAIDYGRLRSVTARRLVNALEKDGFRLNRQSGSHRQYKHADRRRVTVSFHHSSDTFPPKTLRSMIEIQARWTWEDLVRLGLL
ncbi:MAG TPA: type II toxin-antitoxin system HicA family toxin [Terriglobia bacterium]|nr:type II toxin-antitoxin system HicA family toxin [Terriglobia bacterium]